MSMTLAGIFDSNSEAQTACRTIEQAGIDWQLIRVESGSPNPDPVPEDRRGFFAKLFGIGEEEPSASHYAEALRRGNPVVLVHVADEERIDELSDILEDCGAVDVDERVEQWKASGYEPSPWAGQSLADGADRQTMKSVQDDSKAGKRAVSKGRVRVHRTTETPVHEQLTRQDGQQAPRRGDWSASPLRYTGPERRLHGSSSAYRGPERRSQL